jgi:hypothetical protein
MDIHFPELDQMVISPDADKNHFFIALLRSRLTELAESGQIYITKDGEVKPVAGSLGELLE